MIGKDTIENLGKLVEACRTIEYAGGCDRCPMRDCCLDVSSFNTICEEMSVRMVDELLGFADDIEEHDNEDDLISYYADVKRKADIEEQMIDMAWGY